MAKTERIGRRPLPRGRVIELPIPGEEPPLTPGPDLSFNREGLRWRFNAGRVWVNDLDVDDLISGSGEDIGTWVGLADGLNEYRKKMGAYARQKDQFVRFEAVVDALLGKLMRRLKKSYDKKMSGLSWMIEDGQFTLNGINVRSLLALYRLRKTEKARKFLYGVKKKLATLLANREESPDYDRIHEVVEDLYREMDKEIPEETARSRRPLLSHPARH